MAIFNEKEGDIGNFTVEISDQALKEYAYRNFDVDDIFPDDDILRYVKEHYMPGDIFNEDDLFFWAGLNGYKKTDNQ